jgi:hypothetical protein
VPPSFSRKEGAEMFTGWPAISSPHSGSSAHTSRLSLHDLVGFDIAICYRYNVSPIEVVAMMTQAPATSTTPKKKQVQPRHHAPKGRVAASLRRKKIIKGIITGKTNRQAGIDSGLSPKTAAAQVTAILKEPETQLNLRTAMEKLGMDDSFFALQLHDLVLGTKIISAMFIAPGSGTDLKDAGSMTKDFIEVPDFAAKAKGIELAYKLTGRMTDKHDVNVKPSITVVVRKFSPRGQPSVAPGSEGAEGSPT